jgi:hypothetical protein
MILLSDLPNQAVDPLNDLLWRLSVRATVAPDIPVCRLPCVGELLADFGAGDAFVGAVVPFGDGGGDCNASIGSGRLLGCG